MAPRPLHPPHARALPLSRRERGRGRFRGSRARMPRAEPPPTPAYHPSPASSFSRASYPPFRRARPATPPPRKGERHACSPSSSPTTASSAPSAGGSRCFTLRRRPSTLGDEAEAPSPRVRAAPRRAARGALRAAAALALAAHARAAQARRARRAPRARAARGEADGGGDELRAARAPARSPARAARSLQGEMLGRVAVFASADAAERDAFVGAVAARLEAGGPAHEPLRPSATRPTRSTRALGLVALRRRAPRRAAPTTTVSRSAPPPPPPPPRRLSRRRRRRAPLAPVSAAPRPGSRTPSLPPLPGAAA